MENFVEKTVGNFIFRVIHKLHPINTQVSQQDIFMIYLIFFWLYPEKKHPNNNISKTKKKKSTAKSEYNLWISFLIFVCKYLKVILNNNLAC